ncbi:FHA domain-containing protein, partial [Myxococcota bacterium]|nr:FHA domain-containing protein [Myxococcota bacterium]
MEKTRKLDPPDVVYQWTLEIRVRQGATPFLKAVFDRSPIVIGRDSKCDITIPSAHVSRRHLEIHFGSKGIVAIDLGSTNGFKIGKDQLRKAKITPSDVISLGDFEFRAKANPPQKDPSKKEFSDLADGWSDYIDKGITGDTNVGPISYDEAQATLAEASVAEQKAEATEAAEAAIAGHAPGKDSEGYWLAETKRPKLPTLIEDLQKEANALLYGTKQGDLAIEVIHVVGKTVVEMELLAPGEHSWWGGVPTFFGRLLYRPNKDYFPIATHIRPGVFRIQTPSDPRWRVSHRGRNAVEIHRSGPLKGLDGEYGEEVEITHGPFRTLIRCVRAPTRTASRFKLGIPKISRQSMLATLLAV